MREVLDNIADKARSGEDADLKSLESIQDQCVLDEVFLCYNPLNGKFNAETIHPSEVDTLVESEGEYCYEFDLPKRVTETGFWYELCFEFQSSYDKCEKEEGVNNVTTGCLQNGINYYA